MFQLWSISSANSASTVYAVFIEIQLSAHYSMPRENGIMIELYPAKGTMSLIWQESMSWESYLTGSLHYQCC